MERGEVHFIEMTLPDWEAGGTTQRTCRKLVVTLRGGAGTSRDSYVPVVLASTDKRTLGQPPAPYEVAVDSAYGFDHSTIIDCRWVFSLPRATFDPTTFLFALPNAVMNEVSVALAVGLQL